MYMFNLYENEATNNTTLNSINLVISNDIFLLNSFPK